MTKAVSNIVLRNFLNVFKLIMFNFVNPSLWSYRGFLCNNEAKSTRRVLYWPKSFFFFVKRTVVLSNFESYLSLLKLPEFMTLRILKHAYMHLLLYPQPFCSFNETTSSDQIYILHTTTFPPLFNPWPTT